MSAGTALRLAAWGIFVAIVLQVIFYFLFQVIGYDSYLLSITLLISLVIALTILVGWTILKKAIR